MGNQGECKEYERDYGEYSSKLLAAHTLTIEEASDLIHRVDVEYAESIE